MDPREFRKKRKVSYIEHPTSSSPPQVEDEPPDEYYLSISTSKFKYEDSILLKMNFEEVDSFSDIIKEDYLEDNIPNALDLPNITSDDIKVFTPNKNPELTSEEVSFIIKLKFVLENNIQSTAVPWEEALIDNMCTDLFKSVGYDDGRNFIVKPCYLRLKVGEKEFAAQADKECRMGTEVIWILQESKHINNDQEKADIQLVSCMLAACQFNIRYRTQLHNKMFGIKVMGDEVFFYSFDVDKEYLTQLNRGLPKKSLTISKYPKDRGLKISDLEERKSLLRKLKKLRQLMLEASQKAREI